MAFLLFVRLATTAADGSHLGSSSDDVDALLACRALAMRAHVRRWLAPLDYGLVGLFFVLHRLGCLVGIRMQLHVTVLG
jgi:hypothetical protein